MEFDHVIVGGGTAGCILANRLSSDPRRTVCLIEAGEPANSPLVTIPLAVLWLLRHRKWDWGYTSTPQAALNDRRVILPRGKALGGTTAINGMVYIRGFASDYDRWRDAGCAGWGFDDVLPYFLRSEANARFGAPYHGKDGEVPVSDQRSPEPVVARFMEAARAVQLPVIDDCNTPAPEGVGPYQTYCQNGRRVTAADAFLRPAMVRSNLHVMPGVRVRRLILQDGRVTGVDTDRGVIRARAGVVLSAGAFGSPHILKLSGIGPGAELAAHGIPVVRDMAGVGENLQDHPNVMLLHQARGQVGHGLSLRSLPHLALDALNYFYRGRGMWASNLSEAGGFARARSDASEPDVQFHFVPFWRSTVPGRNVSWGHGYALHVCVLRPDSRGSVTLASSDPQAAPLIDPALLSTRSDTETLLAGVKLARRILRAEPLASVSRREALPARAQTDDDLQDFIRARTNTIFHPVGTCRMGADKQAVTHPDLRVKGINGLHIADASIMPLIPSGNTNAAVMMIAEKAAEMILAA